MPTIVDGGVEVALSRRVPEHTKSSERRAVDGDRRKNSRGGRRNNDPHTNWRRLAWLFAAYAIYLSVRSVPATLKSFFARKRTPAN